MRWLAYLGRRLDGVALLVLVARRAGEPGADPELHDRVTGAAMAVVLRPAPLGEPAVARLLEAAYDRVVAPEFARACSDATGGNPFLLRELIASLHADGVGPGASGTDAVAAIAPAGVARAVFQRLAPLGPEALAVAEAAAVLSTDARIDRVATLAGVPLERTAELLDRLADAGILLGGDPIRFRHPILSSAVHDQTPVQRRGLAHLRAAELVLASGAGRRPPPATRPTPRSASSRAGSRRPTGASATRPPRPWRSSLALALATLGRDKDAARLVDEELRLARAFGATRAIGIALRARALLGSGEAQIMGLRDAAQVLSGSPAQLEHTRTLVDLGARCAARATAPRRGACSRRPSRDATTTGPPCSPSAVATSCRRPERAPGASGSAGPNRSRRASVGWPRSPQKASPTGRSPRRCS